MSLESCKTISFSTLWPFLRKNCLCKNSIPIRTIQWIVFMVETHNTVMTNKNVVVTTPPLMYLYTYLYIPLTFDLWFPWRSEEKNRKKFPRRETIYYLWSVLPLTEHIIHWEVSNEASFHLSSFFVTYILKYNAYRVVWETWTTSTLLAWMEPPKLLHYHYVLEVSSEAKCPRVFRQMFCFRRCFDDYPRISNPLEYLGTTIYIWLGRSQGTRYGY